MSQLQDYEAQEINDASSQLVRKIATQGLSRRDSGDFGKLEAVDRLEIDSMHQRGANFTELQLSQSDLSVEFQEPKAFTEKRSDNGRNLQIGAIIDIENIILK